MTSPTLTAALHVLLTTASAALLRCGTVCAFVTPPLARKTSHLILHGTPASALLPSTAAPLHLLHNAAISEESVADSTISSLISLDFGAQVSDGVQTFASAFLIVVLVIVAASTYVTKVAVPDQMARLAALVEKENPAKWEEIKGKLGEGEKLTDRPDLMAELVDSGVGVMVTENEGKMDSLLESVTNHRDAGMEVEDLREPLERAFGLTIEEFVAGVDKARGDGSKFVTETDSKMAELLREEVIVAAAKREEGGESKAEVGR